MRMLVSTVVLVGFFIGSAFASGELSIADPFPEVGKDQAVTLFDVGGPEHLRLWVVYSPNSETQVEEEVGRFSEGGEITWNPARPGIATLSARDAGGNLVMSENVAVIFSSTPGSGVLVMVLAGLLLFGGAALSLWSVLRTALPPQ